MPSKHPRLLVFDSGLGGLTVLRAINAVVPDAATTYVADDAGFPYGGLSEEALTDRMIKLFGNLLRENHYDCAVVACNTASTIAIKALRETYSVPFVGTEPAIKPAAALTESGMISVLATRGTVARASTRGLIAKHGASVHVTLVGAARLAEIAEDFANGVAVSDEDIFEEIRPAFVEREGARTDTIVLGCTHYPLLLNRLEQLAPWPVLWLDPAPAIARRVANVLTQHGHFVGVRARTGAGAFHFTSGKAPSPAQQSLIESFDLQAAALRPAAA